MGVYINPPNMSKETWLNQNAKACGNTPPSFDSSKKQFPVCLINNGPFTAAGICYSEAELRAFNDPKDTRPRQWYLAQAADLIHVSDLERVL